MSKQQCPVWAKKWFDDVIKESQFSVKSIPLNTSKEWTHTGGSIIHKSGLFFKIVGVKWQPPKGKSVIQPMIEQREVGTLGFLILNNGSKNQILVQAKIEPGNIGICQIGPTYQATASNTARVHNGKAPKYKKYFQLDSPNVIFQNFHSEQGSRFLGKLNRNLMVLTTKQLLPTSNHKWITVEQLLQELDTDNFINTDSRSVLVCTPWEKLLAREPFSHNTDSLTAELHKSYRHRSLKKINSVINELRAKRATILEPQVLPLKKLKGWKVYSHGIRGANSSAYVIRQVAITAFGREVSHWDQPIIDSKSAGAAELFCAVKNDVLQFYFVTQIEPGLVNKVELGPSFVREPGARPSKSAPKSSRLLASVRQSDEGGRFYCDVNRHSIIKLQPTQAKKFTNGYWLTLGEISNLLRIDGIFTNEARSVMSLLLKWA